MKLRDYFEGWLSAEDLRDANNRQAIYGGSFDTALLELEVLSPIELLAALRVARGLESTPPELLTPGLARPWEEMPDAWLLARDAVPLALRGGRLWVAIHPDLSEERLAALREALPDAVLTVTAAACVQQIADERRGHVSPRDLVLASAIVEALRGASDEPAPAPAPAPAPPRAQSFDPADSDVTITIVDDGPEEAPAVRPGFIAAVIPSLTRGEPPSAADSAEFDVAVDDPEPLAPREEAAPRDDAAPTVIPRLKRIDSSLYIAAEPQEVERLDAPVAEPVIPSLMRGDPAPARAASASAAVEPVPEDRIEASVPASGGANSSSTADEGAGAISREPAQEAPEAAAAAGSTTASATAPAGGAAATATATPSTATAPATELIMPVIPSLKRPAAGDAAASHAAASHAAAGHAAAGHAAAGHAAASPAAAGQAAASHAAASHAATGQAAASHAAAGQAAANHAATDHATTSHPATASQTTSSPTAPPTAMAPAAEPHDVAAATPSVAATPIPTTPAPTAASVASPAPAASPPAAEADAPIPRARPERSGFVPSTLLQARPPSDRHDAASLDTHLHAALTAGGRREAMIERLRQLGEPAYAKIAEIFPGPLDLPRGDLKNLPPPSAHGPLLRLCIILGEAIAPSILPRLRDANPNTRFYAALVFQELRSPSCVGPLADLAFDDDRDVRTIAMRVLETYHGAQGHARAVQRIRGELHHPDAGRRKQAIQAMGTLRDVLSIPRLIDALDEDDLEIRAAALTSLCAITGQHLGMAPAPWRAWHVARGRMSRGEWMLESLGHGDAAVRRWAAEELVRTTGQRIPFDPRGSEEERAEALARWRAWIAEHPTTSASTSA